MSLQRDLTDRCFTLSYAGNRNWFLKPTTPTTETDARQPIALQAMPPNPHKAALLANFIGRRSATKNVEESGHHFYCRQYCRIAQPIRFHDLHPYCFTEVWFHLRQSASKEAHPSTVVFLRADVATSEHE